MSFAIIQTGGKQYKVAVGDEIAVEKIKGDYKVGDSITIESVEDIRPRQRQKRQYPIELISDNDCNPDVIPVVNDAVGNVGNVDTSYDSKKLSRTDLSNCFDENDVMEAAHELINLSRTFNHPIDNVHWSCCDFLKGEFRIYSSQLCFKLFSI